MELRNSHILSLLETKTGDFQDRIALGMKGLYGWREFTYKGIGLLSRRIARYLIEDVGIKKGECLAILSESKPEYGACVFASVLTGTITVPLDIKLSKYELVSILSDCMPSVMLASQEYLEMALAIQKEIPSIKHILVIDEHVSNENVKNIYNLPEKYDAKWRQRSSKSTAFIIYTSGTTGAPKGVEISFRNIKAQIEDCTDAINTILPNGERINLLSILPMNHLFEMTIGFSTFLHFGHTVYYTSSLKPKDITGIMREKHIQFMIVVPAFLKLLKAGIEKEINANPPFIRYMFKFMYHLAKFVPFYSVKKVMFKKIHENLGGKFMGCISGGAPLDIDVGRFFERIGIKVYQGYGLSETSPVVSVNLDKRHELASVGHPLKHFEARVDKESGELLLRGPSVMKGYHNQPEMTAEVIDSDGWLHTGDIAKIDKDGHLYITGRIKNMIVLSGGKKVFPEEVEAVLEKSHYIAETCVLGVSRSFGSKDGTEEVTAVIVPKDELYNSYSDEDIERMIKLDIKTLSMHLAQYKRPTNIIISKEALPKTTTRKVKRKEVRALINA
ncbi:MAG: AMP-binding protein [Candidatus Gastranaerophilaceae bacterium]|nr:AMP-binding protein [Candidatus Gastranaerophilaceae bacterium]